MAKSQAQPLSFLKKKFVRRYSRKKSLISTREKVLGIAVLICLAAIAIIIFQVGRKGDSQMAFVRATGMVRDVSRAGAMIPISLEHSPSTSETAASEPDAGVDLAAIPVSEGWTAGEVESFDADTLYEKINGRAEAYISFGFESLEFISVSKNGDDAEYVDLYLFNHGSRLNAFGIYASERPPTPESFQIGREGYASGNSLFFWKGNYYAQVIPSSDSPDASAVAEEIARSVEKMIDDDGAPLDGIEYLPPDQVPLTLQYLPTNALSQDFLDNTFTAMYKVGPDQKARVFVSKRASEEDAQSVLAKYKEYLTKYASPLDLKLDGVESAAGDLAGTKELVFIQGPFFAGVTEAPSVEAAQTLAGKLRDYLKNQ